MYTQQIGEQEELTQLKTKLTKKEIKSHTSCSIASPVKGAQGDYMRWVWGERARGAEAAQNELRLVVKPLSEWIYEFPAIKSHHRPNQIISPH